jgi:hypothetical protein
MVRPLVVGVAYGILAVASAGQAQVRPFVFGADERVTLKPDGSYIFNHTDGGLVFEAQVAPDVPIVGNLSAQLAKVLEPERPTVRGYALYATPMFRLRMFNEDSNPVRTPSYMPKVSLQLAWLKNLSTETEASRRHDGPIRMIVVHTIPFGHHSNGQNGCLMIGQSRPECEPKETSVPFVQPFNLETGSFSTNYIRGGVSYHRLHPRGDIAEGESEDLGWTTKREWGVGLSVELHPKGFVGGSLSDELRLMYGDTRFDLEVDGAIRDMAVRLWKLRFSCGRAAASGTFRYIQGTLSTLRFGGSAEALCLPKGWGGTGLFVRYVDGQDYYNLNFATRIRRVQFGFTFGQPKFLMFALPSTG